MSASWPRSGDRRSDEGAVAVTTAILLVALIMMAAVVVDLGIRRVDHRDNQLVSDLAATAGGLQIGESRVDACSAAWRYMMANLDAVPNDEPEPAAPNDCATVFAGECDPAETPRDELIAPLAGGRLEVVLRMPVFNEDPEMQENRQAFVESVDGSPCERISVTVRERRSSILASVAGFGDGGSLAQAVARTTDRGNEKEYATLIVLRARDCEALRSGGGTGVIVFNTIDGDGNLVPGVITSDSTDNGCAANKVVYDTNGNGAYICAGMEIESGDVAIVAQAVDAVGECELDGTEGDNPAGAVTSATPDTLRAFAEAPIVWENEGAGDIAPDTSDGGRITRQLVDHAYNCDAHSPQYPSYASSTPQYPVSGPDEPAVLPCATRSVAAIDLLVDAFVTGAAQSGFTIYNCGSPSSPATRVILDCGGGPGHISLPNAEIVIAKRFGINNANGRGINITTSSDSLTIGAADPGNTVSHDTLMIVPEGDITLSGGSLLLHNTMTYLHSGSSRFNVNSTDPLVFTAPQDVGWDDDVDPGQPHVAVGCSTTTIGGFPVPDSSCFQNLAFWGNGDRPHRLGGSANVNARGVFFFPRAGRQNGSEFTLQGNDTGGAGLDLRDAQFFVWRLNMGGQKPVLMRPNPEVFLETPRYGVGLIR